MASALLPVIERLYPETLNFLRTLVGINSHTYNPAGVNANAARITEQFAPLGFTARSIPTGRENTGDHLFLDTGGSGPAIALVTHLDTVFPVEEEQQNNFHWEETGSGRIYGPGTSDIKGGTVLIWLMLAALAEHDPVLFRSVRWIVAADAEEEIGASPSFAEACFKVFPDDLLAALVFEPDSMSGEGFSLLTARKGIAAYRMEVTGRGAHAGAHPQRGANALVQIAQVINRLQAITDYDAGLTVNVGIVHSGTAFNRVPHYAMAEFEMRAYDPGLFDKMREHILTFAGEGEVKAATDGYPCMISITPLVHTPPWPENDATNRLIGIWREAAEELGKTLHAAPRGGVSDGNFLAARYPTLDALGPAGGNVHCSERSTDGSKEPEFIYAPSLITKAELNVSGIVRLLTLATPAVR